MEKKASPGCFAGFNEGECEDGDGERAEVRGEIGAVTREVKGEGRRSGEDVVEAGWCWKMAGVVSEV
ncbi:MAG: hypothetical protein N2595_08405 [bacterium]|nr:hypothetical protein [bacterium]